MPYTTETEDRQKFRRDVVDGSELNYVKKMIQFYSSQLDELGKMIGQKTEFGVLITSSSLGMIEERLSEFEEKEKRILDNYRKFARKVEGVKI